MKTTIEGKKIVNSMSDVAKDVFKDYPKAACVVVGVKIGGKLKDGRADDGGERQCFFSVNGDKGRTLLKDSLIDAKAIEAGMDNDQFNGLFTTMAAGLKVYRSKKDGSAIVQREIWETHNCAESNLALFLFKTGVDLHQVTIAAYQKVGKSIEFKAMCAHCQQWVRQTFRVLEAFKVAK